jgi:hypothetical protein
VASVSSKTTQHNPETLRVFVSDCPPERGCFGESRDRKTSLWRVGETWKIPAKYEKAGVLRCCKTPASSNNLLRSVSQSFLCESWQTEKLSGTDTSRNAPVFSRRGYGSWAVSANNLRKGRQRLVREPRGYSISRGRSTVGRSNSFFLCTSIPHVSTSHCDLASHRPEQASWY